MNPVAMVGSAIYAVLGAGTVPCHFALAPQGSALPYGILQPQNPGVDEYTFDGHGVSGDWVVKAVSDREWPGEASGLFTYLDGLMQDAGLSVAGWSVLRCRRVSSLLYQDNKRFWHAGGVYRVDLWEE